MPILSGTKDVRGATGYVYDISQDNIDMLVQDMLANADAPFTFLGRIGDKQQQLTDPHHVLMVLERNGQVAATANVAGESVRIQLAGTNMNIIPESGIQSTADMLIGAGYQSGLDDDDFDPFASAGDNFPVPDPRGRSQELANRYGDNEEDYYIQEEAYTPAKGNGDGEVIGVGEWLLTIILLMIPIVNIVMLILWLVSKKTSQTKKNYLKVQIVFWVIGLLLSAFTVVTAMQMGVIDALLSQQSGQQNPPYTQTYDNNEEYDDANLSRRDDSNTNASKNENANMNANSNMNSSLAVNEGPSDTVPETPAAGELRQNTNGTINTDSISRITLPDGRPVAVVTLTAFNTSPAEAPASALFEFTGNQGQNALEFNFEAVGGFDPASVNMPIAPGASGTFQVSFLLVDDQELTVRVISRETQETVLEASQLVR